MFCWKSSLLHHQQVISNSTAVIKGGAWEGVEGRCTTRCLLVCGCNKKRCTQGWCFFCSASLKLRSFSTSQVLNQDVARVQTALHADLQSLVSTSECPKKSQIASLLRKPINHLHTALWSISSSIYDKEMAKPNQGMDRYGMVKIHHLKYEISSWLHKHPWYGMVTYHLHTYQVT